MGTDIPESHTLERCVILEDTATARFMGHLNQVLCWGLAGDMQVPRMLQTYLMSLRLAVTATCLGKDYVCATRTRRFNEEVDNEKESDE